jgi:hypothetical protein
MALRSHPFCTSCTFCTLVRKKCGVDLPAMLGALPCFSKSLQQHSENFHRARSDDGPKLGTALHRLHIRGEPPAA